MQIFRWVFHVMFNNNYSASVTMIWNQILYNCLMFYIYGKILILLYWNKINVIYKTDNFFFIYTIEYANILK